MRYRVNLLIFHGFFINNLFAYNNETNGKAKVVPMDYFMNREYEINVQK